MLVPEFTYTWPLAKDQATQSLELIRRAGNTSGTLGADETITSPVAYVVPLDRVLILSGVAVALLPEVNASRGFGAFYEDGPDFIDICGGIVNLGLTSRSYYSQQGEWWIPPGARLFAQARFSAPSAVVAHSFRWAFHGLTIPRGSVTIG